LKSGLITCIYTTISFAKVVLNLLFNYRFVVAVLVVISGCVCLIFLWIYSSVKQRT